MYRGRIAGEVPAGTAAEEIGLLMTGSSAAEAKADAPPLGSAATSDPEAGGAA
jgi:hypothetical protein